MKYLSIFLACLSVTVLALGFAARASAEETFRLHVDKEGVWLLNTQNGMLSFCTKSYPTNEPFCSPWAAIPPVEGALYRDSPENLKLLPANEADQEEDFIEGVIETPDDLARPPVQQLNR